MTSLTIKLPANATGILHREWSEFMRRWSVAHRVELSLDDDTSSRIEGPTGSIVSIPHQRLAEDTFRWQEEATKLLTDLPSPEELLADPASVVRQFLLGDGEGRHLSRFDLPGILHGFLTRREEKLSGDRDEHGRWQPETSLLKGWLDVPLVDLIARGFGQVLSEILDIELPSRHPSWKIAMTFDIDSAGQSLRSVPRGVARSLRSRGLFAAARTAREGVAATLMPRQDARVDFDQIVNRLEDRNLQGLFFAQSLHRSRWDDYELPRHPRLIRSLRKVRTRGHQIGLHGSYATAQHGPQLLRSQRDHLARLVGGPVDKYRGHYLRTLQADEGERLLKPAGLTEDWTIGFSQHEGFRLGTAFPVESDQGVTTRPLHVMDVTLRFHRGYSPEVALASSIRILSRVRDVGGTAVVLWHPHNMGGPLWPGLWQEIPWELADWALSHGANDALR